MIENLLSREEEFIASEDFDLDDTNNLSPYKFYYFLLHAGYLILAKDQPINSSSDRKFVIPNKETKEAVDQLMKSCYLKMLRKICPENNLNSIIEKASTNEFIACFDNLYLSQTIY